MNSVEQQLQSLRQQAGTESPVPQAAVPAAPTLSYVTPTELVELPSKGLFYPEGHPLHGKDSVEIKQMTAKEEDILTNKSFIKKGVVIDKLVESLLVDKAINVDSLLVGDKNAIMIAARINAYGPAYDVVVGCMECSKKNQITVNLSETVMRDIQKISERAAETPALAHQRMSDGSVTIRLPKSGWEVNCKLTTSEDERKIVTFLENKRKLNGAEAEISISEQLYFIIDNINGVGDTKTIRDAISLMPAFDAKHLRSTYIKLVPNISIEKSFTCSSCGDEQELEVPFTQEFFWPK